MKRNDEAKLRELLGTWKDLPAVTPDLAARVERAVAGNAADSRSSPLARLLRGVGIDAGWWRLASAGIAAGVLFGIGVAEWRRWRAQREPSTHYLQWIDPTVTVATPRVQS